METRKVFVPEKRAMIPARSLEPFPRDALIHAYVRTVTGTLSPAELDLLVRRNKRTGLKATIRKREPVSAAYRTVLYTGAFVVCLCQHDDQDTL